MSINWDNPDDKVSNHFSVRETLYLPIWNRMANESDGLDDTVKANLITLCGKLDQLRDVLAMPINVHVTYRPSAYNALIKGAPNSYHVQGLAMDFNVVGQDCEDTRQYILSNKVLELLNMRMEDNGTSAPWIHLDCGWEPGKNRFFKP